jgi:hypothetical protein
MIGGKPLRRLRSRSQSTPESRPGVSPSSTASYALPEKSGGSLPRAAGSYSATGGISNPVWMW